MEDDKEEKAETIVERAEQAAKKLEETNKRAEDLYAKQQALAARQIMGGKSAAGEAPEPKKIPTNREYAEAALKGKILK